MIIIKFYYSVRLWFFIIIENVDIMLNRSLVLLIFYKT